MNMIKSLNKLFNKTKDAKIEDEKSNLINMVNYGGDETNIYIRKHILIQLRQEAHTTNQI